MTIAPGPPRITVVIVNYNRRDDLRLALASVARQEYPHRTTLVVDNASSDGSAAMVAAEFPDVEVVELDENLGMAGYDVGFDRAATELLFQMDNDSLMTDPSVLGEVVARFDAGPPELAAVACRVEEAPPGADIAALRERDRRRGPLDTGGFHAGGVGFRRSWLAGVGYPREVFLYGAELFLQLELLARGGAVHYFPEILMLHRSSGVARSAHGVYYELRNRYWLMRRWADAGERWRYLPAMVVYDAVYALARRQPGAFLRAVRHGFAPLPAALRRSAGAPPVDAAARARVRAKVREVGRRFGPAALCRSVVRGWRR